MVQQRRAFVTRRALFRLGLGAAVAGAALATVPDAEAVPLSGVSATVSVASLAVRSGPSSANSWIGTLPRGTVVSCTSTAGAWFRVSAPNLSGWVHSGSVTLRVNAPAVNITRGSLAVKAVCLSFDADIERGYTSSILDTLAAKRVKASFALTGEFAALQGDLVRRMVNEGHHVFNHSLTHRSFTGLSGGTAPLTPAERLAELIATEQRVAAASGHTTRPMFRPPYGDYDASVLRDIAAVGFTQHMKWTVDTLGWNGYSRDQIINRVLTNHGNGYIYVLHLGTYSQDGPALPGIIDGLRSMGYGFGTLPEIMAGTASSGGGTASCSLSPLTGIVDSTATVTCKGFASGENVAIHWGKVGSTPLATVKASSSGTATATVTVPKGPMTKVVVTAVGATSKRRGTGEFSVTPSVRLSRTTGPVGTSVTATLRGFGANQPISITWRHAASTVTVATVQTSYSGSGSVSFVVPAAHYGSHVVEGVGGAAGRAGATFSVTSTLSMTPADGPAGTSVRATLRGFGNGESVALSWRQGSGAEQSLGTVAASSTGSATATIVIPIGSNEGSAAITATGSTSRATASRPFSVAAGVAPASEATATPEPTATPTAAPAPTASPTPTIEPSPTVEPTATPTPTPTEPVIAPPSIALVETPTIDATNVVLRIVATAADTVSVEYGLDSMYGTSAQAEVDPDGAYRVEIESLLPNTVYHYRVTATGAGGEVKTEDATFTTALDQEAAPSEADA